MKKLLLTALLSTLSAASAASLVFGGNGEPVSLESGNITDGISILVQRQIYDTLVDFKPGSTDLAPGLATSWKANANNTAWTFTLRKGVRFHDGTPMNADAIVFNLSRWWDKSHPYGFRDQGRTFEIVGELLGGYKGDATAVIKNIVKVNDTTVRVDLNKPSSVLPNVMAAGYFGIASPTAIKKEGAKYGTPASKPVGTGPFIFQSWRTGDRVTLLPNKLYWGEKAKVDQLIIRNIKDASQRLNELKAGTIDFANDLTPDSLKSVQADKNLVAVKRPSFNVGFVSMNNRNQYLKNQQVRQAISMAINKKAIVDAFWNGLGVSNASFVPPVMAWANSSKVPADYKFDPAAAKKMLAEAGYPNGFSIDLWYMPVSRPYFPTPKPIAEAIAADLSAIGIKVNLKTQDWAKYLEDRNKEPGFDMYMIGWTGDYGDPDNFYGAYYGSNASDDINWNPANVETLLQQGRAAATQEAKAKVYSQLHEITYNAAYRVPMVHSNPLAAARSYVKGWVPSPLGSEPFNTITVTGKK
ncbi:MULTISPECIES: ABC transporter substrate-binding protein [unclassified Deinococcus]|uniref:ABC transporter substrate-binding protein n=1 Tax=unclassified Deinococcus TaxID=2623546 RepID=UPI000C177B44|nr:MULTISPECIES: ABC transporter substrate-binding protein [unclassified Deinococcus]MCD0158426.1 ABC transporter substrate-binding protein [Deinococcus sp. 6GRE01]MCD0162829.1 ABC transporter substrate-binding protein [Deinococcus sp. 6YEL10]MCD0170686.1 ABC transporter substrate-binding protein [Deinococcus sp. 23YEL01]MCD0176332.1 ABC transporter substrate-binding protein [Deinococcus sp. 14RED07]PIG97702.1 ABC transporter substrate-binding protein [Deinococcus sp. UR1]